MNKLLMILICGFSLLTLEAKEKLVLKMIPKGEEDRSAEFNANIEKLRKAGGGEILFGKGEYYFASPTVINDRVSNHDTPPQRNVFIPLINVENIKLRSKGARFICDGEGIALGLIDAKKVTIEGIVFDYKRPFYSIWKLKGHKLAVYDEDEFIYEVNENNILFSVGTGWKDRQMIAEFFDAHDHRFLGQIWWDGNMNKEFGGYPEGCIVMTRSPYRPNPCVFLYRADNIKFSGSGAYAAAGMGLLAQRSSNILIEKWHNRGARPIALQADATHFSNCRGKIAIIESVFEGMVDDAINVHSTSLKIVNKLDEKTIECQFMHGQSMGFEVFKPGETLRFIKGDTLEPGAEVKVKNVQVLAVNKIRLELESAMPSEYKVGDAVENADYQPAILFKKNIVRNSSPRATLFTTPKKVICEENIFENVAGQPIYFAGDARNWYESGASRDVVVRKNIFNNCGYKSGMGMIQIEPTVHDIWAQSEPYHQNILIEDNTFENFTLPLVWARSCKNVRLKNNKIINGNTRLSLLKADVKIED